jgi:regulator of RNase E activity RraA
VSGQTSRVRGNAGRLNVPVSIGGVVVIPGDAVLCDDDGILILPPKDVADEAGKAIAHQERVKGVVAELEAGKSLSQLNGASKKVLGEGAVQ